MRLDEYAEKAPPEVVDRVAALLAEDISNHQQHLNAQTQEKAS